MNNQRHMNELDWSVRTYKNVIGCFVYQEEIHTAYDRQGQIKYCFNINLN